MPVGHGDKLAPRPGGQLRRRQTHRHLPHAALLHVQYADRAGGGGARHRVRDHARTGRGRHRVRRPGAPSRAVGDKDRSLGHRDAERRHADIDLLAQFQRIGIDDGQRIAAAEGHVGQLSVGRKGDPGGQRMAVESDAAALPRHPDFGDFGDQDAVRPVARGLAGPEFAVSGAERDYSVGGAARRDIRHLRARGAIQQQDAARVEHRQDAPLGIVGHIHGAAGDHRLLAPRAQQLIGREQEESARLFADGDAALQYRKDAALLGQQRGGGQGEGAKNRLTHGSPILIAGGHNCMKPVACRWANTYYLKRSASWQGTRQATNLNLPKTQRGGAWSAQPGRFSTYYLKRSASWQGTRQATNLNLPKTQRGGAWSAQPGRFS